MRTSCLRERLAAHLLDHGLVLAVTAAPLLLASVLLVTVTAGQPPAGLFVLLVLAAGVGSCVAWWKLLISLPGRRGASPGKRWVGLRVQCERTGGAPGRARMLLRWAALSLDAGCLLLPGLLVSHTLAPGSAYRHLGDLAARTRVVRA